MKTTQQLIDGIRLGQFAEQSIQCLRAATAEKNDNQVAFFVRGNPLDFVELRATDCASDSMTSY